MEHLKVKSAPKIVTYKKDELEKTVLDTMHVISSVVGSTLGPGGRPVLIERYESELPSFITKDGVTVFRSLGFTDSTKQCILEAARDAAIRTANEAGDGTTTATILADAIVTRISAFCKENPKVSPQRVVRHLEGVFKNTIEPLVTSLSRKVDSSTPEGEDLLSAVAKISANGDTALSAAVMECFDITGDDGNVTIAELSGPSSYQVEAIDGYSVPAGWEDSTNKYYSNFINDPGNHMVSLPNTAFVLYNGRLTQTQTLFPLLAALGEAWNNGKTIIFNYVVVATGFSDDVLSSLAINFAQQKTLNIFPLITPQSPQLGGQFDLIQDVAAITGAVVFDPVNNPLMACSEEEAISAVGPGIKHFEATRTRSNIIGFASEELLEARIVEVKKQVSSAPSVLDSILTKERLAKLSGGIARLKVVGSSNGEMKEKRDRAEDAVCAVRGAIKHGVLPGGCWTLLKISKVLNDMPDDPLVKGTLWVALQEPFNRLLDNVGLSDDDIDSLKNVMFQNIDDHHVYDALEQKLVNAYEAGILDSTPAVVEAIRNALSIASQLGTLGGTVVFARDRELERSEAREDIHWKREATEYADFIEKRQ